MNEPEIEKHAKNGLILRIVQVLQNRIIAQRAITAQLQQ